jgi:hypothetical protein
MPQGLGETYFVAPREHAVTNGLLGGEEPKYMPQLSAAQSIRLRPTTLARPLLVTSPKAFSVRDIRPFVEEGRAVEKRAGDASGPFNVAIAAELPHGGKAPHGPRIVIAGSASLAFGQSWRDAALIGNRLFVESALAWLAAQPSVVSVPEKPSHAAGMSLTEDSLGEILRYVLVYMPVTALLLGGLILYRRRVSERRSRRIAEPKGARKS